MATEQVPNVPPQLNVEGSTENEGNHTDSILLGMFGNFFILFFTFPLF